MIPAVLGVAAVLGLLILMEYLWRHDIVRGEASRKLTHIIAGSFVAFWPFFMSFHWIEIISLGAIAFILSARYLRLLGSIHSIERRSIGDALFALGVGLAALLAVNKWIFAAAILHLSIGDGLAGLIGSRAARKSHFKLFGEKRTLAGSLAFFISSLAILSWLILVAPAGLRDIAIYIPWLAFLATVIEAVSTWGSDNVLIPLFMVVILNMLR